MKRNLVCSAMVLFASICAQTNAASGCPDISGKWIGVCKFSPTNLPPAAKQWQSVMSRTANEFEITQFGAANPVGCNLLVVDGSVVTVGGLHTESISVPLATGDSIGISTSASGAWDLNTNTLGIKSNGIIHAANDTAMFDKKEDLSLRADGTLDRRIVLQGENFRVETNCNYRHH